MEIKVQLKIVPYQQQKQNLEDARLNKCHWETSIPKQFHPFQHQSKKNLDKTDSLQPPKTLQQLENEYHKQRGSLAKRPQKKIKVINSHEVSWPLETADKIKGQTRDRFNASTPYQYKY